MHPVPQTVLDNFSPAINNLGVFKVPYNFSARDGRCFRLIENFSIRTRLVYTLINVVYYRY